MLNQLDLDEHAN